MSDVTQTPAGKALVGEVDRLDSRLGSTTFLRRNMRKIFPDHWSFMLGEIALYSFVILLLTGVFLTLFFDPSMNEVVYHGSYTKLDGVKMSEAYRSTLDISFDVRGGLLIRQIHHWAAVIFVAAMMVHMLRIFFTGAFRKPREINWVIGVTLLVIGFVEGLLGYSLPDDLLSGTGMRILAGVLESIPVIGTYMYMLVFGGEFPGHDLIPRLYTVHILLIPGIILALVTAHMMIMWHQKHTQWPGKRQREKNVVGAPFFPSFMAKTGAFFLFIFGITTLLSAFAQINPIWMFGPYRPESISAGSQPDWYMGFLEGALRMMPRLEFVIAGHYTISLNVLIPAVIILGLIFTVLGVYPFIEQWATGDKSYHNTLDRPRNAPVRTGFGFAGVTFYGVLWLAGANDVISHVFEISLYTTTWIFRVAFFVAPVIAFVVARRICLGLQRKDAEMLSHGYESGIIKRLPSGEFIEVHQPLSEERAARLDSKKPIPNASAELVDANGVPEPGSRGPLGKLRLRLNRLYVESDYPFEEAEHGEHEAVEGGDGEHHEPVGASSGRKEIGPGE